MKVETLSSGPCRMKLIVNADAAETRPDYEQVVAEYVRHGRLPGFRPGKAPQAVVVQHYRNEVDSDVRGRLIGKFYRAALDQAKIRAEAVVDVTDVIFTPETGISFVAVVDVAPEFKLPKYKKIPIKVETPVVTDEQVSAQIDRLRNMVAHFEDAPGRKAARGDMICIDYVGSCGGKPLEELAPDAAGLAKGTDFWTQIDEPEFIPGLVLALEGLGAGDSKEVPVKFGKDFRLEAVRGREVVYRVQVKNVRVRHLPADEEVCKRFGMESLDAMRERFRKDLLATAETQERGRQEQEVIDFLLKRTEFELPQSVVAEETNLAVRGILRDIVGRGASREEIAKNRDQILGAATNVSRDRVRIRYILSRIAEEEKVQTTDAEVTERLERLAAQYRVTLEKIRSEIEKNHGMEGVISEIRNEKTLALLVAEAKTK